MFTYLLTYLDLCNAELSPERFRPGLRSPEMGRGGTVPDATLTSVTTR